MPPQVDTPDSKEGIAMIDFSRNHFELFGLPERFRFDPAVLDRAYHALQGVVHPDRHAAASEAAQRIALQSSARVNEAYRALRDPVERAQYLLSLHGIEAFSETDTSLPFDFLERQLERREAAGEAAAAGDAPALAALLAAARAESAALEQRIAGLLDTDGSWDAARARVRELKFLQKLAGDIDAMLAEHD
jgi:molecular chaperone HscB